MFRYLEKKINEQILPNNSRDVLQNIQSMRWRKNWKLFYGEKKLEIILL